MIKTTSSPSDIFNLLYTKHPKFHGREDAGSKSYALKPEVLQWIIKNIPKNSTTLETGCGYSTVILATLAKKHTVISPFSQEHQLIRDFCETEGISTSHIEMISRLSQEVIPQLQYESLDFILIDGDHAFPAPFIDWYYTADSLKVGGYIAIDDTHIPTGKILMDFLNLEIDRWTLTIEIGTTAIFKRISKHPVAKHVLWTQQPYCKVVKKNFLTRFFIKLLKLKNVFFPKK